MYTPSEDVVFVHAIIPATSRAEALVFPSDGKLSFIDLDFIDFHRKLSYPIGVMNFYLNHFFRGRLKSNNEEIKRFFEDCKRLSGQ